MLFHQMGTDGVYARTALYEDVVERLAALITRNREPNTEVMRFPPVMSRAQLEKSGYLKSFPNLLGCVCGLHGTEREINAAVSRFDAGGDWTTSLSPADLVLSPAACYPVYPIAAAPRPAAQGRPALRRRGRLLPPRAVAPSRPAAIVPDARICLHRHARRRRRFPRALDGARAGDRARSRPAFRVDYASDPFFGRVGQMKAVSQKQQSLKFELLVPLRSEEQPTACMSFNYHREHFGTTWGIQDANGEPAHTGCVAFGMDRLAVAMFHTHGTDLAAWPAKVRDMLGMATHATAPWRRLAVRH